MTCSEARAALVERLDGEMEALDAHLRVCATCAAQWHALSGAWQARGSLQAPPAPPFLQQRVLAQWQAESSRARGWNWLGRGLALTSGLCYGVLGLWLGWALLHQEPRLDAQAERAWAQVPDYRQMAWMERQFR